MTDNELLTMLIEAEGFVNLDEFLECFAFDSVVPGICKICHATVDCEPDARRNYCDNCTANGIESGLSLAGLV